ncbi:MAG: DUF262 domain-containing protein, partial [Verrucomicrobia bacterium]|nr:DUF262 domain-containing protein [Verrucomicrobiota bacterium]
LRVDEAEKENERVAEMLELVRRRSGKPNIIFILDEVGQYIAARDNLILNLDGLAKNVKNLGGGKVWLVATAQQTLTEDDPNARFNSAKLFKLADRFPIRVDLEASDIREICYNRLLTKSSAGDKILTGLFDSHGPALKHHTQLTGTRYYKSALEKDDFRKLYPFLPQHFDILLELLGRLAKTSGGIGLRSAIKVIQDVLVDQSGLRPGQALLADAVAGELATTITFYDTLRLDIQRSFKHVVEGVARAEKAFGGDSFEVKTAKVIAVLQVLDDFPISRENVAALLHPRVDAASQLESVKAAVTRLMEEKAVHLNEVDGKLRFMSEAVAEMEAAKGKINVFDRDLRKVLNEKLTQIFTHQPEVRLEGTRSVAAGMKTAVGAQAVSLLGEREPIQYLVDLVDAGIYDKRRDERIADSATPANRATVFWLARQDTDLEKLLTEVVQCREVFNQNRNKTVEIRAKRVSQLLKCVEEGRFAIPKLQREFVWDGPKAAKLFDSILAQMPIGVVMIWETPRSQRLYLRQKYHVLPQFNARNGKVWFLIDGQQRVSVLHRVREGSELLNARDKVVDFKRVVFSLEYEENGQQILYRKPRQGTYESLTDILHPHWRSRVSHLGKRNIERVRDCRERILRYPIHLMFVQAKISGIRETFLRINTQGMKIGTADAIFTQAEDLDLRDIQHEVRGHVDAGFGMIPEMPILFAMAASPENGIG